VEHLFRPAAEELPLNNRDRGRLPSVRNARAWLIVNSIFPVLLALLVLGWGTGYKLSLYKTHITHDSAPAAKLCTRSSDVAKSDLDRAANSPNFEPVALKTVPISIAQPSPPFRRSERDDSLQRPSLFHSAPALYLRPPPYLSRVAV
jgi:hypothetical protein